MLKKSLLSLFVLGAVTMSGVCFASLPHGHRSETANCPNAQSIQREGPASLVISGKIIAIEDERIVVEGTGEYDVAGKGNYEKLSLRIVKPSKQVDNCGNVKPTQIYDTNAKEIKASQLKVGMNVNCYYHPQVTRSYPGQANAKAIIVQGTKSDYNMTCFEVMEVEHNKEKGFVTLNPSNETLVVSMNKTACADYDKIKIGDEVIVWYKVMTMSLPPRTSAVKAIVL
ncbi:MAG: hypothetical protein Q4D21_09705 [Phascolarctobacterium sp.]|nr:hypothetical protein [Phascolarctobacterium sp.]